jgi:multisubunit Na+/H+ antiporter MnhB subunit
MSPVRMLGIVVFAVGIVLLYFGYHASNAPVDQLSNTLTGRFTDRTMWYFVGGGAAAIGGALLAMFGKPN